MAYVHGNTTNRINPVPVSVITQPHVTYDEVALCADPNCPVCRAQRRDKHEKHRKKHHHHHHHRHRKHRTNFWNSLLPRVESPLSTISVHNVELNDRAVVPVNQTDRQVVSTTTARTRPVRNEEVVDDAWTREPLDNDEVVCCRAYNGCRCPCWCFIILLILFVLLIIILIVLLVTLL